MSEMCGLCRLYIPYDHGAIPPPGGSPGGRNLQWTDGHSKFLFDQLKEQGVGVLSLSGGRDAASLDADHGGDPLPLCEENPLLELIYFLLRYFDVNKVLC